MNRRIAAIAIAALSLTGLAACSGGDDSTSGTSNTTTPAQTPKEAAPTEPAPEPTTPAPAENPAEKDTQDISAACIDMAAPMAEASGKMLEIYNEPIDAQATVDSYTALVDAFADISSSVTNAEIKAAATTVYEDVTSFRDSLQKVYVEGDYSAMGEYTRAAQDFSASYSALLQLCGPNQ